MVCKDLLSIGDEPFTLFGVAGDGGAGNRKLDSQLEVDGGIDDGIEAEDFLLAIGILGISANTDSCIHISWKPGTTEEKGVGFGVGIQVDASDDSSFWDKVEPCFLEVLLKAKNLVKDAGRIRIGLLKTKGEEFHLGFWDIMGKFGGRTVGLDADFFAQDDPFRVSEAIEDFLSDVIDDVSDLDCITIATEMGTPLVPGICGEKGAIGCQDVKGDKTQELDDFYEDMKDRVI